VEYDFYNPFGEGHSYVGVVADHSVYCSVGVMSSLRIWLFDGRWNAKVSPRLPRLFKILLWRFWV